MMGKVCAIPPSTCSESSLPMPCSIVPGIAVAQADVGILDHPQHPQQVGNKTEARSNEGVPSCLTTSDRKCTCCDLQGEIRNNNHKSLMVAVS